MIEVQIFHAGPKGGYPHSYDIPPTVMIKRKFCRSKYLAYKLRDALKKRHPGMHILVAISLPR